MDTFFFSLTEDERRGQDEVMVCEVFALQTLAFRSPQPRSSAKLKLLSSAQSCFESRWRRVFVCVKFFASQLYCVTA